MSRYILLRNIAICMFVSVPQASYAEMTLKAVHNKSDFEVASGFQDYMVHVARTVTTIVVATNRISLYKI
jgi:hypothetical protein